MAEKIYGQRAIDQAEKFSILSLGTDGTDGPTDAAGSWLDYGKYQEGISRGLKPENFSLDSNTYEYFERLGTLIKTGPTGTNLMDFHLIGWNFDD